MVRWKVSADKQVNSLAEKSVRFKRLPSLKLVASSRQRDSRRQQAGDAWRPQPLVRPPEQRVAGPSRVQDQVGLPTALDGFDDPQKDDHVLGGQRLENQEGQDHLRVQQQPGEEPRGAHQEGGGEAASGVASPESAATYAREVASEGLVGKLSGGQIQQRRR